MTDKIYLYEYLLLLPAGIRVAMILGVFVFVLWPICAPWIMQILSFCMTGIKWLFRGVYYLVGWFLLSTLHRQRPQWFGKLNLSFTDIMGNIDDKLLSVSSKISKNKKRFMPIVFFSYVLIVGSILLPDILEVNENALINGSRSSYLRYEQAALNITDQYIVVEEAVSIFETPPVEIMTVPEVQPEGISEEPNMQLVGTIVGAVVKDELVRYTYKFKVVNEQTWFEIVTESGLKGWIPKRSVEMCPANESDAIFV